jgi:hypothetical protein
MRRLVLLGAIVLSVAGVLGGSVSANSRAPFPASKLDLRSSLPTSVDMHDLAATAGSSRGGVSGTGNPPRVGPNVRANAPQVPLLGRSETSLTVHGNRVVAGWNDAQGFCGPPFGVACDQQVPHGLSGYAYSTDGGATFTDGGGPDPFGGVLSRGDPWLDDNGQGTFFYANLAVNITTAADLGVGVWRGAFTGSSFGWNDVKTFNAPNAANLCPVFGAPAGTVAPCDFYDKEALVAGKNRHGDDAYVSLTNFKQVCPPPNNFAQFGFGQIEVWRTHDGGATWLGPAIAGPEAADSVAACGFEGTLQQSSAPAIGPNGEVYVVWQFGPTFTAAFPDGGPDADIYFAKSTDGGVSFGAPTKVADINSMRGNPPVAFNRTRINDHPRVEVALTGAHKGRIYVTYYSSVSPTTSPGSIGPCPPPFATSTCFPQNLTSTKVFIRYSDDGGATWSPVQELGGSLPSGPAIGAVKRWWPDVSVGSGGDVHVVYYQEVDTDLTPSTTECNVSIATGQRRIGSYSALLDTWWTYSSDGGGSWSMPLKLSEQTTNVCLGISNIRPNIGDYIDAEASGGNEVAALWAGAPATSDNATTAPIDSIYAVGKG